MSDLAALYDEIYMTKPDKWTHYGRDAYAELVIEGYRGRPGSLLDIGCGNGHTIDYLHASWPDTKFSGLDISPMACKLAKAVAPYADIYNVEFGSIDLKFDVITLMGVAEHFEDITKELEIVSRLLAPGGTIYIEAPNNMAISGRTEEGWFGSSIQTEWYLKRDTWVEKFKGAKLMMVRNFVGPTVFSEFVWLLEKEDKND